MSKWVLHIVLHVLYSTRISGGVFYTLWSKFWRYFGCFGWQKYLFFQQIWHLHFKPSVPDFKTYIFGMLIQFLIDLQKRNCWFFLFGGSLGPVWLVHNLNLLNLDRLTKLPQLLLNVSNEGAPCLPSSWIDFSLCCWFCVIWSKSYFTLAVMSSGFSGHVSFYLHKAHSAVELNLLFTFVWLRS